jgi:hypothetical protein
MLQCMDHCHDIEFTFAEIRVFQLAAVDADTQHVSGEFGRSVPDLHSLNFEPFLFCEPQQSSGGTTDVENPPRRFDAQFQFEVSRLRKPIFLARLAEELLDGLRNWQTFETMVLCVVPFELFAGILGFVNTKPRLRHRRTRSAKISRKNFMWTLGVL